MVPFLGLVLAALFVGAPTALYFRSRDEARRRWLPRASGVVQVGDGGYRGAEVPRMVASGPPWFVHVTAVMCWVLGAAFVPGVVAALVGLLAMGVGLVAVPGLILAARLFRLGGPLLRGESDAADRARGAARFARVLNYVVLAVATVGGLAMVPEMVREGLSGDAGEAFALAAVTALYACVSLVHARLLDRSAEAIDVERAAHASDATGEDAAVDARTGVRVASAPDPSSRVGRRGEEEEVVAAQAVEDASSRAARRGAGGGGA